MNAEHWRLDARHAPRRRGTHLGGVLAATLCAAALIRPVPALADIWKRVDADGVTHLSDQHLGPGSILLMRTRSRPPARTGAAAASYRARVEKLTPLIDEAAGRLKVNAALVHAVIRAESAYDPHAVSSKGAVGLMQLMPETAARYGVADRTDPAQNVVAGVRYLRDLVLQFRSLSLALAAYNAGEGAVARHGNQIPPFPETQQYVERVIRYFQELRDGS